MCIGLILSKVKSALAVVARDSNFKRIIYRDVVSVCMQNCPHVNGIIGSHWSLQWCHNERYSVSNHRRINYSKLRVTGLCVGNSPVTDEFPAQRASNAENVSIWWRHHVINYAFFEVKAWYCSEITYHMSKCWSSSQTFDGDAVEHLRFWSKMVYAMGCFIMVSIHYLGECRFSYCLFTSLGI